MPGEKRMAGEIITTQELVDAKVDAKDLGEAVNEDTIVTPRYGDSYKSLPMVVRELEQAIDIAAAAGAGANGWTDQLVQTWSGRTQEQKNKDSIHIEDFRLYNGVAKTDQQTIQDAVDYCITNNRTLDWDGAHLTSTDNILGFWDIAHKGQGSITRGASTFNITPIFAQESEIFVKSGAVNANDGLTEDYPATWARAWIYMGTIGNRAGEGNWRIHVKGQVVTNGVRLTNFPVFKNPLQLYGDTVTDIANITSIIKGQTSNTNVYALRAEESSVFINLEVKYIKFTEWQGANPLNPIANAGAVLLWNNCKVFTELCDYDKVSMGVSIRKGYLKAYSNRFIDNYTYGTSAIYNAHANIGNLIGGGNTFIRSSTETGRNSIMYIQGNTFEECNLPIKCTRLSRIRTQANTFTSWTGAAITCALNSVYTPDNDAGYPDILVQTPSIANPFYSGESNSSNLWYQLSNADLHLKSNALITVANSSGVAKHLRDLHLDWYPFRLPAYALYSDRMSLNCSVHILLPPSSGACRLAIHGASPSNELCYIQIPAQPSGKYAVIDFEVFLATDSIAYFIAKMDGVVVSRDSTSLNSTAFREALDARKIFRFYFTPSDNLDYRFRKFESKIVG